MTIRERVILSTINNIITDQETRANAIDDTTRVRDEGFNVDVYLLTNYKKFDLNLFITDTDIVVESFIIKTIGWQRDPAVRAVGYEPATAINNGPALLAVCNRAK